MDQTLNQIRHLGFCGPDELRVRLGGRSPDEVAAEAASLRPRPGTDPVLHANKVALRILGQRVLALAEEKAEIDALLGELVTTAGPHLLALNGDGVDTAALLLVVARDTSEWLRSEAAWAHLCGVAPIQASSRKVPATGSTAVATARPTTPVAYHLVPHGQQPPPPGLRRTQRVSGSLQARDHAHPQALHRP